MPNSISSNREESDAEVKGKVDPHQLLNLTKALIKFSVQDGDRASQELSIRLSNIQAQLSTLELKLDSDIDKEEIKRNVTLAMNELMKCFIELQFFDRISQRLDHATRSIDASSQDEQTKRKIAECFAMEDERILYDALLNGENVECAVQKANAKLINIVNNDDDDDIELF